MKKTRFGVYAVLIGFICLLGYYRIKGTIERRQQASIMAVLNAATQAAEENSSTRPGGLGKPIKTFNAKNFANRLGLIPVTDCPSDFQTAWQAYAKSYWKVTYAAGADMASDVLNTLALLAHNSHGNPNLKTTRDMLDLEATSYEVDKVAAKYHVTITH